MTEERHYSRPHANPSPTQIKSERRMRRSKRLKLSMPVLIQGKSMSGEPFREITSMLSVNAHGGLFPLAATVQAAQTVLLENRSTRQE